MDNKLYIIGNGFDLHHGLKTSYSDFREKEAKNSQRLWPLLQDIFGSIVNQDMWWCNFEEMLGEIDYKHLTNSYNGMALGPSKVKNLFKGTIPPLFSKWIRSMEQEIADTPPLLSDVIDPSALYFTFNYTMLLETAYHINSENVWYIHHSIKEETKKGHLVVGHDSDNSKLFKDYLDPQKNNVINRQDVANTIIFEAVKGAKGVKNRIIRHKDDFARLYSHVDHYVSMGFSFNDIDMPYIEEIVNVNKNISEAKWELYWHSKGEEETMRKKLQELGVSYNNIIPIEW